MLTDVVTTQLCSNCVVTFLGYYTQKTAALHRADSPISLDCVVSVVTFTSNDLHI